MVIRRKLSETTSNGPNFPSFQRTLLRLHRLGCTFRRRQPTSSDAPSPQTPPAAVAAPVQPLAAPHARQGILSLGLMGQGQCAKMHESRNLLERSIDCFLDLSKLSPNHNLLQVVPEPHRRHLPPSAKRGRLGVASQRRGQVATAAALSSRRW